MSIPVSIEELPEEVARFGPRPYLLAELGLVVLIKPIRAVLHVTNR